MAAGLKKSFVTFKVRMKWINEEGAYLTQLKHR